MKNKKFLQVLSPINIFNLSSHPSHENKITSSIKKNKENKINDLTVIKINQSTNSNSYQSSCGICPVNLTQKFFYNNKNNNSNKNKPINEVNNNPMIHSNGKFNNAKKQKRYYIRKQIFENKIILNNNFINNKLKKNFGCNTEIENYKNRNWRGLNISSHYLGNTNDNKFGVVTNKFYVNTNLILTSSQNNIKIDPNLNLHPLTSGPQDKTKTKKF